MRRVEYLNGLHAMLKAEGERVDAAAHAWAPALRGAARAVGALARHATLKASESARARAFPLSIQNVPSLTERGTRRSRRSSTC